MEITDMKLQSLQLSWDAYPKPGKTYRDLDVKKVKTFVEKLNESGRFRLSGSWKEDLKKLRLIDETSITNAAWLLFANEDIDYNLHIGGFKTLSYIVDYRMFNNTLFETVEKTVNYIIGHLTTNFKRVEALT